MPLWTARDAESNKWGILRTYPETGAGSKMENQGVPTNPDSWIDHSKNTFELMNQTWPLNFKLIGHFSVAM